MKFGKRLAGKQLELPDYNGHFINYKALKKLIKQLSVSVQEADSANSSPNVQTLDGVSDGFRLDYERLQENKASFFFKLERELENVNEYYMEKEADLRVKFEIIQSRYQDYLKRGKLNSKRVFFHRQFRDSVKKFERDLMHLEEFVELNRTGFSKVLKKWDKRSHSHTKDFYLATVVSVQPIFTRYEVSKWNDAILAILLELDKLNDNVDIDGNSIYHQNNQPVSNFKQPGLDTNSASTPHEFTFTREQPVPDNSKPFISGDGMGEIEFEIESWYMEALQISRLKDDEPKFELLESFVQTKVQSYVDEHLPDGRIDKRLVIREALTKLFLLLVSSNMDDSSLKHFLLKGLSNIDLTQCDAEDRVFSRRNVLHEAANCASQSRVFVLEEALTQYQALLITEDEMRGLLNGEDVHGRTPLHYACERGKTDFAKLLVRSGLLNSVDIPDNDSRTPLVLSIINNNVDIAELLLVDAQVNPAPCLDEYSKPQFSPLSVACAHKNLAAAKLILEIGDINLETISDSQGLRPLHIVAKNGGDADLITLLVSYGADPNGVDSFNKWAPIFYAIQEGHATTVKELLKHGAKWDLVDEDNLSPLFYALWEGHLSVLNILLACLKDTTEQSRSQSLLSLSPRNSNSVLNMEDRLSTLDSLHNIPDFELPPPIIPLRKYGHNFLEKKIFVKIIFKPGRGSIKLNKEDEMVISSPGRITLTSSVSDIIPRNVLLPIQDDEDRIIVFQVSAINDLSIDFELFPSFGTRLIAKTNAMPSLFHNAISQCSNLCHVSLPLFDSRLKSVGELDLSYQVIFPYNGRPLEITKYDTYWKSTSGSEPGPNGHAFVTSSSLAGKYATVMVTVLSDGRVVAAPRKYISAAGDAKLLLSGISSIQLESLCGIKLDEVPPIHNIQQLKDLLKNEYVDLDKLMNQIQPDIQLDIDVFFPTPSEINSIPVSVSAKVNINTFVDNLLFITFSHIRHLSHKNNHTRSIVFSSCNPHICSILNWKQPNYPVMYQMNGLKKVNNTFIKDTPNHLSRMALSQDTLIYDDTSSRSIREAVHFASTNNMLGIIVPLELLSITPQLIGQIKHYGLLLIGSQSSHDAEEPLASITSDINAIRRPTELEFKGAISM